MLMIDRNKRDIEDIDSPLVRVIIITIRNQLQNQNGIVGHVDV